MFSLKQVTRIIAWLNLSTTLLASVLSIGALVFAIVHKLDLVLYFRGVFILLFFRIFEFVTGIILVRYTHGDKDVKDTQKWIWFWFYSNLIVFILRTFLFKWMEPGILAVEMFNRFLSLTLVRVFIEEPGNITSISAPIGTNINTEPAHTV